MMVDLYDVLFGCEFNNTTSMDAMGDSGKRYSFFHFGKAVITFAYLVSSSCIFPLIQALSSQDPTSARYIFHI